MEGFERLKLDLTFVYSNKLYLRGTGTGGEGGEGGGRGRSRTKEKKKVSDRPSANFLPRTKPREKGRKRKKKPLLLTRLLLLRP